MLCSQVILKWEQNNDILSGAHIFEKLTKEKELLIWQSGTWGKVMNYTVQSWTWTIWQYLPNPVISPCLTIPGCYSEFEKNTCVLKKYKVSPYFNMKALLDKKRIYLCKHLKEMERISGKWMWLVIPSGRRTAAVKYSVLTLEVDSSIVFDCCWLIHSDTANSHAPPKTKVGTRTCLTANSL